MRRRLVTKCNKDQEPGPWLKGEGEVLKGLCLEPLEPSVTRLPRPRGDELHHRRAAGMEGALDHVALELLQVLEIHAGEFLA